MTVKPMNSATTIRDVLSTKRPDSQEPTSNEDKIETPDTSTDLLATARDGMSDGCTSCPPRGRG